MKKIINWREVQIQFFLCFDNRVDEAAHDENEEDGDDATGVGLGGDDSIDLGTFQRPVANPYWTLGRPSEPINLMSSLLAADPPRPGPHGLYGIGERPLEIGIPRAALQDGDGGTWHEKKETELMRAHV